ncbi:MAG: hypothetical protein J1D77_02265 [Muribaculaceae bacterium]|nr:hypothetical protein [Muribaculaceae bacterium]
MIESKMNKLFSYIATGALLTMVMAGSCKDDDLRIPGDPVMKDGVVMISAKIEEPEQTRTLIDRGPVTQGKFTLTYPYYYSGADAYGVYRYLYHYGDVTFGYQGSETTGFVNAGTPEAPKELVWSPTNTGTSSDDGIFVYPSTTPSPLVLDNFMYRPILTTSATSTSYNGTNNAVDSIVNIKERYPENPYKAGIFDRENGTNDLLWGKTLEKTGTYLINFNLTHRMCRLILNVVVEPNNAEQETETLTINLEHASVKITDILLDPVTYMRLSGELLFQTRTNTSTISPTLSVPYQDFRMVRSEADEDYNTPDLYGNFYHWADIDEDTSTGNTTYTTQDFVFVPQKLRQGTTQRPRIVIAVPQDDVNGGLNTGYEHQDSIYFSGNVPVTMYMDNGEDQPQSLQTLNFDAGKVITLTTKMKPGEMELEFAPVTVEPWVYKGTFYPMAKQSGIYSEDDLYELIKYYKRNNDFWLHKYGYIENEETGLWKFMINTGNLEFEASKIVGQMIPGIPGTELGVNGETTYTPNFNFDFRNRDEYYLMPDGTKVSMGIASSTLTKIVQTEANQGVEKVVDFNELITAYQNNFWQQFIYGAWNDDDQQWIFKITDDLTLNYESIVGQMIPPDYSNPNFKFAYDPATVTVKVIGNPGGENVTAEGLYSIVSNRISGLYSQDDFMNLLKAIKSNQTSALGQFGSEETGAWIFPLRRNITVTTTDLQGALYGVDFNLQLGNLDSYTLTLIQYDKTELTIVSSDDLQTLLGLQKPSGIDSAEDFYALIDEYNSGNDMEALARYGYYCITPARWIFFLNDNIILNTEDIEESMPLGNGNLPFSFKLNNKMVEFEGELQSTYPDGITGDRGAKILYEIVTGEEAETEDP